MADTLSLLPFSFWVVIALLAGGTYWARLHLRDGLGLPVIAVLGTVAVWYVGDAFYNDYRTTYAIMFTPDVRSYAWWQVALFLATFLFLVREIHHHMNRRILRRPSQIFQMVDNGCDQNHFQEGIQRLFWGCLAIWGVLVVIAAIRLQGDTIYYFFPYLSYRADPWARGRIGTGFDSLLSFAMYLQIMVAGLFGIIAALVKDRRIRILALIASMLIWPYFLFDRTRNVMLVILLPGILSWIFIRLRVVMWQKFAIVACFFVVINAWFAFVLAHRSEMTVTQAFMSEGFDLEEDSTIHHEGLNMFEELCWLNTFFENGTYQPNWGSEYFAEIVNPIPRSLWSGKPLIGIDYAILRGQAYDEGDAGVGATLSTGLVGQGVDNFGRYLGPPFSAMLMAFWAAYLARLDLSGQGLGRIPLYGVGLILTFNLGRDITLITLYTFVFGRLLVWLLDRAELKRAAQNQRSSAASGKKPARAVRPSSPSPTPLPSTGAK